MEIAIDRVVRIFALTEKKKILTPLSTKFRLGFAVVFMCVLAACSRRHQVVGTLTHAITGEGLPNHEFVVTTDGKEISASTDAEGRFNLDVPENGSDFFIDFALPSGHRIIEEDAEFYFGESVNRDYRYVHVFKGQITLINRDSLNASREWKGFSPAVISEMFNTQGGSGQVQFQLFQDVGSVTFTSNMYSGWNYVFGYIHYKDPSVNAPTYFIDSIYVEEESLQEPMKIFFN